MFLPHIHTNWRKFLKVMDIFSNYGDNITSVCLCPKSARCTPLMHAIFGISTIHHEGKKKSLLTDSLLLIKMKKTFFFYLRRKNSASSVDIYQYIQ